MKFSETLFHINNRVEVSGGTEKGRYSLALGNDNAESLLKESYNNRLNVRMTLDTELAKWLTTERQHSICKK